MRLTFAPACLPLMRGGLPHSNAQTAMGLVLTATPEVPSWPALAQRTFREGPVAQAAAGLPGLVLDTEHERVLIDRAVAEKGLDRIGLAYLRGETGSGALPTDHAAGLGELLRQMSHGLRVRGLKGDMLGPLSLSLMLTDEQERPLAYDPMLRETIVQHLALRMGWMFEQLSTYSQNVIVCLDEPFLDALSSPFSPLDWEEGSELLGRVLADAPGCRALSIRGAPNWEAVLSVAVELVLFDAYEHSAALIQAAPVVARYLEQGGMLGWGIVPNDPTALSEERAETLAQRFERTVDYLAAAGAMNPAQISNAAFITTSGSLAQLSVESAEQALKLCANVARLVREIYPPE